MLNKKVNGITCALLAAGILSGCNSDSTDSTDIEVQEKVTFTILHTNDNHGRFWQNDDGEYGMAARKTLIDTIRAEVEAEGGVALVLSGGDVNTGVPESDLQDAIPDFIGMNRIAYDAMAVGNHEFDNPLQTLEMQRDLANFPMLSANIYNADGSRYFAPSKTFDINGVSLALIGFTTDDTAKLSNPEFIGDLTFTDPQDEAPALINELRADGADIVMAVTHMGHYADAANGSNAPGDVALARSLSDGQLDAIIGGHSQNPVCMEPGDNTAYADFNPGNACVPDQQNGTYIMQAHEWGKYVGRADFTYENGELTLDSYALIPVNLKEEVIILDENGEPVLDEEGEATTELVFIQDEITPDPSLLTELAFYQEQGEDSLDETLATLTGDLNGERDDVRSSQTNMGRLIAIAQSDRVNADFGVMNSGGVRASIAEGDITYRDVLTVQPFGNTVTLATMTGAEVKDYLGTVATFTQGAGAYAQITDVVMDVNCTAGSVDIISIGDKDFSETDEYTFSIPSFNAAGGDGYPELEVIDEGTVDADALQAFFVSQGNIIASEYDADGDITYINSTSSEGCVAE
ncbi:bifunctional UDP-sugar hydrolase/5'-nucleotidase UshA [Psychromonas sp. SP041]|uniref:bifunctional UDP-sugar hydrolase/5'-nucleotidase UshA n=1 Tax=Psychromonas sp. SP041 TaxID=1365007 RepID=UPI00040DB21D|nr:bifunctional UDP-sugar hydrolase/5'-nucleotidase UshA [Psychromonas sp. SP041]